MALILQILTTLMIVLSIKYSHVNAFVYWTIMFMVASLFSLIVETFFDKWEEEIPKPKSYWEPYKIILVILALFNFCFFYFS